MLRLTLKWGLPALIAIAGIMAFGNSQGLFAAGPGHHGNFCYECEFSGGRAHCSDWPLSGYIDCDDSDPIGCVYSTPEACIISDDVSADGSLVNEYAEDGVDSVGKGCGGAVVKRTYSHENAAHARVATQALTL